MAKPRCDKHKRSLPYCDACKEAVRLSLEAEAKADAGTPAEQEAERDAEAEEGQKVLDDALRKEESDALQEGIGFPGAAERTAPTVGVSGEGESELPEGSSTLAPPVEDDGPPVVGGTFPPDEPADWDKDIDKAEETMAEAGEFDPCEGCSGGCASSCEGHPDPGSEEFVAVMVTPQVRQLITAIENAISNGEEVTVIMGDAETRLRQEGRKEVIAMVREWFSDSMDTGAFKLLEHLEKKVR
ncbi:hypothetical protein LCGC14_2654110 [marine sediment metagenome]|uniref:Uncharacterized protein n=1 Tax=marine sediment metagenome TaxID=412755 RepID=A0A0F9AG83_9ZZZZ